MSRRNLCSLLFLDYFFNYFNSSDNHFWAEVSEEFIGEIMDGTLNYFKVDTKDYSIRVDGDTAHMKVTHTLTAKVYGISGSWTMSGENTYKKRNGIWVRVK